MTFHFRWWHRERCDLCWGTAALGGGEVADDAAKQKHAGDNNTVLFHAVLTAGIRHRSFTDKIPLGLIDHEGPERSDEL
jgi:hypothetical protein